MSSDSPIWLTEADVVSLVSLADAIPALERVLAMEARGEAENMVKTHLAYHGHDTLHAIGAAVTGAHLVGTKTWCHTEGGAAPVLILWDAHDGALQAVIEAFALGQMRTGGISGLATKWLAAKGADEMAVCGTGKQAVTQVAAVHAAMRLKRLRVWSPTPANRDRFAERMKAEFGFAVATADTAAACVRDAPIVTAVTLARKPFIEAAMLAQGAHFNAVGAIVPERVEFSQDVFPRCAAIAVDSVEGVKKLSNEFIAYFGGGKASWDAVRPLSAIIAEGKGRPAGADLTLFKAMGMGLSDLAMGTEILARARRQGVGQVLPRRVRAQPRLRAAE
jgi:ornithine cyclodeaminase